MKKIALTALVTMGFAAPAFAQATNEQMEMAYNSARNQLGVLKYCQNGGHIDGEAATVQEKLIALIPAPSDTSKADEAQASGEAGTVVAMGVNQEISATVKAQNITEKQFCETVSNAIKQVGGQLPK